MDPQPEFIVTSVNKYIKPPYKNQCKTLITVNDFTELSIAIEQNLQEDGMDYLYLCHIINDNDELHKLITKDLFDEIRHTIEIDIGDEIDDFWSNVSKKDDYHYTKFDHRKFPSVLIKDQKWRMVMDRVRNAKKLEDYPNGLIFSQFRYKITDQDKKDTNFNSIPVYPVNEYTNEYSETDLTIIFSALYKMKEYGLMLKLWCKLLIQYETTHLIIHNMPIWYIMKNIESKPNVRMIMDYSMFYGLYILSREEIFAEKGITADCRFTFNAKLLRQIPSLKNSGPNTNPWNTYIIGSQYTTDRALFHVEGQRKLTSEDVFNRRLHIATGGVFKNIDLKKFNAILTGSILAPCAAYNPLEQLFIGSNDPEYKTINQIEPEKLTDEEFNNYINYLYPSENEIDEDTKVSYDDLMISDLDVAIKNTDMKDYIQKSKLFFLEIKKNVPNADLVEYATTASMKYKIIMSKRRSIDLFPVKDLTWFDLVRRFHLSVVRMF